MHVDDAVDMSKMIQIRDVSDEVHRRLRGRAAMAGQTLSDFLRLEIERLAARPTRAEMLARLARHARPALRASAADAVRAERDRR